MISRSDPTTECKGAIKFMNCVATLKTKAKTKFFMEYHSSCLESKDTPVWHHNITTSQRSHSLTTFIYRICQKSWNREPGEHRGLDQGSIHGSRGGKNSTETFIKILNIILLKYNFHFFWWIPAHTHHLRPRIFTGSAHSHQHHIHRQRRILR